MKNTTTQAVNRGLSCKVCDSLLKGKQTKYCSRVCHNKCGNHTNQNYTKQQERGLKRKIELLQKAGGKCSVCSYKKNLAALTFHHTNPTKKDFSLTIRECSNNAVSTLLQELSKCLLLCHNCHMELHYPHFHDLL
jgi:hypothetical protein